MPGSSIKGETKTLNDPLFLKSIKIMIHFIFVIFSYYHPHCST